MTEKLFQQDAYLLEFDAEVVERCDEGGRPGVVLDRTAFYAESGGQPADAGTLDGVPVLSVIERGDVIVHVLAAPLTVGHVHGCVDGMRRRDHREQHHGQHLLSRAFVEVAQAATVAFHLGSEDVTIDLGREVSEDEVRAAETRANEIVWAARPVSVRVVSREQARDLGVAVPDEARSTVRIVEAEGFDLQACSGTHPRTTAEVGAIFVLGRDRYKGASRVRFVCGHRALAAFRERAAAADQVGALLSAPLRGLAEAAQRAKDERAALERRARELLAMALQGEATRLLASLGSDTTRLVVATYDGWPQDELRQLAQALVRLDPCVALLASRGERVSLVFAQREGLGHDVPGLLREAVGKLGGRGGGKGDLAQGAGERSDQLGAALEAAAARVRGAAQP